jgi:hypothetical protein
MKLIEINRDFIEKIKMSLMINCFIFMRLSFLKLYIIIYHEFFNHQLSSKKKISKFKEDYRELAEKINLHIVSFTETTFDSEEKNRI